MEETLVYQVDNQLVARIYPNYTFIENMDSKKNEEAIALNIAKILERVRRDVNMNLPASSKISRIIEQDSPFIKTPTNKIKRVEYVPGYLEKKKKLKWD